MRANNAHNNWELQRIELDHLSSSGSMVKMNKINIQNFISHSFSFNPFLHCFYYGKVSIQDRIYLRCTL